MKIKNMQISLLEFIIVFSVAIIASLLLTQNIVNSKKYNIDHPITTDVSTIEVKIVDTEYKEAYTKKTYVPLDNNGYGMDLEREYPVEYITTVEHGDHYDTIKGMNTYYFCKEKEGENVKAHLNISSYKDGTLTHSISMILD